MFTSNEFFFFWLPGMCVGSVVFSLLVADGRFSTPVGIALVVVLGIVLKVAARKFNPPTVTKPQSEVESNEL